MIGTENDLMRLAHDDPRYIIESGFYVVDLKKDTVPMIFNEPQNLFYDMRTTRDDILKAGKLGLSTEILAILTVKFLLVPNSWSVCISHEDEATQRLFEKVDFFLKTLPPWLKKYYIPGRTKEGDIANQYMHSKFYIGTAGARAFGRGDTPHYVHMSETSRWNDKGRVMTGLIRAVPLDDPHTWIVKETTANGQGTPHHIEYKRAKEGRGEFRGHFLPWFSYPKYRLPGPDIAMEELRDDEKRLIARFKKEDELVNKGYVNIENIRWRTKMIGSLVSEDGRSPEDMFKQEFPSDDTEAFLFSGNPIFPVEQIEEYKVDPPKPIFIGNLQGVAPAQALDATPKGWLKIWRYPMVGSQYLIFADVGQTSDYCSAHILAKKSWKIVAHFHAQIKSNQFGDELNKLGHYYNKAEIAVEVNNMGQSTVDRLLTLNYPTLYMRERLNVKTKQVVKEFGWMTTGKSKALMIGYAQNLIRTKEVPYVDDETLQELSTYIKNEDGTMGASVGNHDDRVISFSGAYYILKLHPFTELQGKVSSAANARAANYRRLRAPKMTQMRRRR